MKKQEFIDRFGVALGPLGLAHLPIGVGTKHDTYYRLIDDLVLMLILEIATGKVTASWWIGATFAWGHVPEGVPKQVYRRIPVLLSPDDRREILGAEDPTAQGSDSWWTGLTEETLAGLSEAVRRTEPYFLARAPIEELRRSPYCKERRELIRLVCREVPGPVPTMEQLTAEGALVPWVAAAEALAKVDLRVPRTRNVVTALAEDAALCTALGLVAAWPREDGAV